MAIFNSRKNTQIRELADKLVVAERARAEAEKARQAAIDKSVKVQELLVDNILALTETQTKYVGNDYRDYATAVKAIAEKYNGVAEWGCLQVGTIIDLRAAFILGEGIKVVRRTPTKKEAEAEIEWANDFLEYNALDAEMAQELAKESEIEGKLALVVDWDTDKFRGWEGMPTIRYVSWSAKRYKVITDPNDYLWYKQLKWDAGANYPAGNLNETEFVYKKFGGRLNEPNEAQPKVMKCLTEVDRLDRALRDLREINHLFAAPTADFECDNPQDAKNLMTWLESEGPNWKFGKAIAHIGRFSYKSPDAAGVQNLISEIETTTKLISGTTGIPIHYLGMLDLLRNRATGDNTRELVMAATTKERSIWVGAFEELIEKAMALFNEKSGRSQKSTKLDFEKIGVEIPLISQDHWANIQNVLIPAFTAGIISKEFVASQIPGVDMDDESARAEAADQSELAAAKTELERMRADRLLNGGNGKGNLNAGEGDGSDEGDGLEAV